jgi:hypothetical protein
MPVELNFSDFNSDALVLDRLRQYNDLALTDHLRADSQDANEHQ